MIWEAKARDAEEIAIFLRQRGRIIVRAPRRSGKTTELLRYAEERYPNGRFAVVCANEDLHEYIIQLHWDIFNGIDFSAVVAERLLGEELERKHVNDPLVVTEAGIGSINPNVPIFVDDWDSLCEDARKAIAKRKMFIASVTSE